ncbi:MAG: hypothetical protein WCI67_24175 [Chloroflexales bacterium]
MNPPPLTIGGTVFDWGRRTYLMGILNVTPDSFSGDGLLAQPDWVAAAVAQAQAQLSSDRTQFSKATIVSPVNGVVLTLQTPSVGDTSLAPYWVANALCGG